ncbi:alpha/beta-hydrolase [Ceratobasidium sp. AG-I]|nr:alpha/beta-hydrolase [Ceratobasidium sp. AG-I]
MAPSATPKTRPASIERNRSCKGPIVAKIGTSGHPAFWSNSRLGASRAIWLCEREMLEHAPRSAVPSLVEKPAARLPARMTPSITPSLPSIVPCSTIAQSADTDNWRGGAGGAPRDGARNRAPGIGLPRPSPRGGDALPAPPAPDTVSARPHREKGPGHLGVGGPGRSADSYESDVVGGGQSDVVAVWGQPARKSLPAADAGSIGVSGRCDMRRLTASLPGLFLCALPNGTGARSRNQSMYHSIEPSYRTVVRGEVQSRAMTSPAPSLSTTWGEAARFFDVAERFCDSYDMRTSAIFLGLGRVLAHAQSLSVKLPDATYTGYRNATSGLNVWLGVRYAAPPVGPLRWSGAQAVGNGHGVVNATTTPLQCVQSVANWNATNDSEDCLYLNIYAPPGAKNLPVLVWATQFDPTPLINMSGNKFIAVIIQYRVRSYHSGSDAIKQSGGFNAGITDARFALEFVQNSIDKFGGSKADVSIWGQSSGGGTVLELIVQEGRLRREKQASQSLFKAAILSSPWFPPMGGCADSFSKDQFKNFTAAAGCSSSNLTESEMLSCLRETPSATLKQLNYQMNKRPPGRVNYWTACLEDESGPAGYLKIHPAQALKSGVINGDFVLAGSNAADGSAPTNLSTPQLFQNFLTTYWPLDSEQVTEVENLYPANAVAFSNSHARGVSVYQDVVFSCGSTWVAEAFTKRRGSWRYLFGIMPFGGAMTNFTVRHDPNSAALNGTWSPAFKRSQVVFNMTSPSNVSSTRAVGFYDQLSGTKERCDFWAKTRVAGGW